MEKFSCKNCGACCTRFGIEGALPFFEWEIDKVKKEAKNRKIKLNIKPLNLMFDEISGIYFFPQYGMFNEPCPFLGKEKCLIYSKRPAVCRMFPLIKTPLIEEKNIGFGWFSFCPNFNPEKFIKEKENLSIEQVREKFDEFGECNEVCFKATKSRNKIDEIMKKLIQEKRVKLRSAQEIEEKIKALPILRFLVKINAISPKEKIELIKEFK